MNRLGQGREPNLIVAYAWYSLAAEYIPKDADEWLIPRAKVALYERRPKELASLLNADELRRAEQYRAELAKQITKAESGP